MRVLLVAAVVVGGCVSPAYEDCVLTCGANDGCPSGLVCDGRGWCRARTDGAWCPEQGETPDAPDPPDAEAEANLPDASSCACDPFFSGCCGDHFACDVVTTDPAPFCREVTADGKQASQCQNATQCAVAHTCLEDPAPGTQGTCHEFCDGVEDCQGGSGICELAVGAGTLACTTKCNPRDGAGCQSGHTCVVFFAPEMDRGWTDCRIAGAGVAGQTCAGDWECVKGHFCRSGTCERYCRDTHDGDCPDGQTCQIFLPVLVANERWGYCD